MNLTEKQFDFIGKEIELTYGQIDKQRETTIEFLKIYLSIILGLFAYIYFIENRLVINNKRLQIPNDDFIIFGLFGVLICLITFIIGWAVLDNITKSYYKTIKHYKHISYLRFVISQTFDNDLFSKNSILPIKQNQIPIRISAQVPIIGAIFNFGLLLLNYYFLSLFNAFELAFLFTMVIISIISIFYSNQLEKHFEEILIAQKLKPRRDETSLKTSVRIFVRNRKQLKNYIYTKRIYNGILFIISGSLFFSFMNLHFSFFSSEINRYVIFLPIVPFIGSLIPRYYMGRHRIENLKCFR